MVIVYNPPEGAEISEKFKAVGLSLAKPLKPNSTQYCEENFAQALVDIYPFLQIVSAEDAKELKKAAKQESKSEDSQEEEELLEDIPVAETKATKSPEDDQSTQIPDDLKGTDWYGDGPKEDRHD